MAVKPIPEDSPRVSPYLIVKDVTRTMDFLKYVFGAEEREKMTLPDGTVNHGSVSIGNSVIMMGKATEDHQTQNAMLYIYVEDTDAVYKRAIEKGAVSVMEPADQFYGDRNASVKDGDGVSWWMATHIEDVSPEEVQKRNEERAKK
jgi:PhnB protein